MTNPDAVGPPSPARAWIRHLTATRALGAFSAVMAEEGVEWLAVKGIVAAHTLYADPSERPMRDIDVRVRPRDFGAIIRAARRRGWAVKLDAPRIGEAIVHVDGWEIDVESTIGPPGLCALSVDSMLRRSKRQVDPLGFIHRVPDVHDHALILGISVFKDLFVASPWAREDLLRIASAPTFDPSELVARAVRGRVGMAMWLVADWLAGEERGRPWAAVRDALGPGGRRSMVAHLLERRRGRIPGRLDLWLVACASDSLAQSLQGASLATLGAARARLRRAMRHGRSLA